MILKCSRDSVLSGRQDQMPSIPLHRANHAYAMTGCARAATVVIEGLVLLVDFQHQGVWAVHGVEMHAVVPNRSQPR